MSSFQHRVFGAIQVRPAVFEEVEADPSATGQAAAVVAAAALSGAIANLWSAGLSGIVVQLVAGLLGWAIAAYVVLVVGTRLLPGKNTKADYGQLLRTTGFAQAAGVFSAIGVIPVLGWLPWAAVQVWVLVALVVAVRQALDYEETSKAVITCLVAWLIIILATMVAGWFGIGGAVVNSGMM